MQTFLLFTIFLISSAFSQIPPPPRCTKPLAFGKKCSTAKPSIRYHFDKKTGLCMAFKHKGCGGNNNKFATEGACYKSCLNIDHLACPVNSAPLKTSEFCYSNEECGPKGTCLFGNGYGICCKKTVSDKVNADYHPKCAKGKKVYEVVAGGIPSTLIGKTCKSNHCPKGATCVQGTYFATCCA